MELIFQAVIVCGIVVLVAALLLMSAYSAILIRDELNDVPYKGSHRMPKPASEFTIFLKLAWLDLNPRVTAFA